MGSYLFPRALAPNETHREFKLRLPISFPTMLTITLCVPPSQM